MAKGSIPLTSSNGTWQGRIDWVSAAKDEKNQYLVEATVFVEGRETIEAGEKTPFYGRLVVGTTEKQITFPVLKNHLTYLETLRVQVTADGPQQVRILAGFSAPSGTAIGMARLEGEETVTLKGDDPPGPSELFLGDRVVTMGDNLQIAFLKDHPDCVHELSYRFGGYERRLSGSEAGSYLWRVPDLSRHCILNGTCILRCKTYLWGSYLGAREKSVMLKVPDPVQPQPAHLELGKKGELYCRRTASNFYLKLRIRMGGKEYAVGEGKQSLFSWTPPYDLAALYPEKRLLPGSLICQTFNQNQLLGSREAEITLTVPENDQTRPRIRELVLTPVSGTVPESFGFLRGKTGLKADFRVDAPYSEVSYWEISTARSKASGNPAVIPILEEGGEVTVTARVRDRRGFTGAMTRKLSVIPYEKPRLLPYPGEAAPICGRAGADGALSPKGQSLRLRLSVGGTEIAPEVQNLNPCSLKMRLKQGEGAFGESVVLLKPGEESLDRLLEEGKLSLLHTYQAELTVEDALGEKTVVTIPILSQAVSFGLYDGPDGVAFGKYPEIPHTVDLAPQMTLLVRGKLDLRGETWQPLHLAAGVDPSLTPHGNLEGVQLRLHGGNQVILCFSCAWPGQGKVINRDPVPQALRPGNPVSAVCPSEGGLTLATLEPDGLIRLSPLLGKETPGWIQGTICYFT